MTYVNSNPKASTEEMAEDQTRSRYNRWHNYGEVFFYLTDFRNFPVYPEQARYLLLKVIEQAIRDYISLVHSTIPSEQQLWETARGFLFDDDYIIDWGNKEINLDEALMMLGLDTSWVRKEVHRKFREHNGNECTTGRDGQD